MRRSEADRNAAFMRTEGRSRRRLTAFQRFQRGAIKSVGHSHMECGGKRSATPLWLVFVPYPSQDKPSSQSGVALRLPPHSIWLWPIFLSAPGPSSPLTVSHFVLQSIAMESNWAAEHLQVIRTLMERSAVYRRALAPIMIFNGIVGVAG